MSRVTELFAMRLARRRGETRPDEEATIAELDSFGESLGIGRPKGSAKAPAQAKAPAMPGGQASAPAMPDQPAMPAPAPAMPERPLTGLMAPTAGAALTPTPAPAPAGIPALDALTEKPNRRNRGITHDRTLGRVLPDRGGMGG